MASYKSPSRLELNFRRLLARVHVMVADEQLKDFRTEKYIEALETMFGDLKTSESRPGDDILREFRRQLDYLQGLVHANSLCTPSEKTIASQMLPSGHSLTSSSRSVTKEIHLMATEKYNNEMRKELLENDGIRRRTQASLALETTTTIENDYDVVLKYHSNVQEKIAEEMVSLARNLKENSLLAGSIIRKDTEIIDRTTKLAEQNYDRLNVESSRLIVHARKGCNWWIWVLLLVVCGVFVFMIFFMKLFRK